MAGRVGFVLDALSWAGASVLFAIGLASLVGWTNGHDELIRLHPTFAPAQWTTALSLVTLALALILAAQRYRRAARLAAVVPAALGIFALIAAALHAPPAIDRILARLFGVVHLEYVQSMAPTFAIGVVSAAAGVMMLTSAAWRPFAIGLTIPIVVTSLPVLAGYASGAPALDTWTDGGGFAVHVAIALLSGAVALGASSLAPDERESPRWLWMPVAVAVLMVAPIVLTWEQEASMWGAGATLTETALTIGIFAAAALGLVLARGARRPAPKRPAVLTSLGAFGLPHRSPSRSPQPAADPSDDLFRALTLVAPVGIYVTDARGHCLFVNEHWCRLAGMSSDEATNGGWRRTVHEDDRERVLRRWNAQAAGGDTFDEDYRFDGPDGQLAWVEDRAMPIAHGDGRVAGYVGVVMDVGARRQTEIAAARREEAWRLIIEAQQGGVFEWDIEGDEAWWSPRVHELVGFERDAQPTLAEFQALTHPDDRARLDRALDAHLEAGAPLRLALRLRRRSGEYRSFLLSAKAARDAEGRPLRVAGSIVELP